jgi:glutamine cyclotransferase
VAFIYDKETFQQLNKLYYPIKEGWGIAYNGSSLIMSDGSNILYMLDKEYFTELSRVEVYDDNGPVKNLNELEYINGEIWANVYTTDVIVRINPLTGAVIGKIDLSGLLRAEDKTNTTDVLNGIAFDPVTKRIFVTGKRWPKLFEISTILKK